jgi:hypothetical protein
MLDSKEVGIILFFFIGLVLIVIIILKFIENRLKKKLIDVRNSRDNYYLSQIEKVNELDQKKGLKEIDKLARDFFKEAFNVQHSKEYSELEKVFLKKKNKVAADFCALMTKVLYSGNEISKETFLLLVDYLNRLIATTHILSKAEQQEIREELSKKHKKDKEKKGEKRLKFI